MSDSKKVHVLVGDDQVPVSPSDVAGAVLEVGFAGAAARYSYSESTLRKFLSENGIKSRRVTQFERMAPGDREATPEEDARHRALAEQVPLGG